MSGAADRSAAAAPPAGARADGGHALLFRDAGALHMQQFLPYAIDPSKFPSMPMEPRVAKRQVEGLRNLDATPRLNLASFVTTYMEPECCDLMNDAIAVNYIDTEEYPSTEKIKAMCVRMLADLWHADENSKPTGTDTVGSSEAILLAGLALKRRWQERRKAAGQDTSRPNIVMGTETHVVWAKLANYFEVEPRWVANRRGRYMADNSDLVAAADENTIGIVAILGTTYTGHFYDVESLDALVAAKNQEEGWELGIHVDAASGGFVAPFAYPELKWDFALPNVVSINASGHKFGLVYPGIGWVMFRSRNHLPESLIFHDNYLGKDQITFTLNFSKGAMNVVGQLYQFIRFGFEGYREVNQHMLRTMQVLSEGIESLGMFEIVSSEGGLPVVAFHLKDDPARTRGYDEFQIADRLRMFGWVVPAYTLAPDNEKRKVLRIVCRWDFPPTLAAELIADLKEALDWLADSNIYTKEQIATLEARSVERAAAAKAAGKNATTGPATGRRHGRGGRGHNPLNHHGRC